VVTHQLQVERRTGKVRLPETDVLPLCHATNYSAVQTYITAIWAYYSHIKEEWGERGKEDGGGEGEEKGGREKRAKKGSVRKPR